MQGGWEMLGGKFAVLATMLEGLRRQTKDRIVIVSNYTQTLDLFFALCRQRNVTPPCLFCAKMLLLLFACFTTICLCAREEY